MTGLRYAIVFALLQTVPSADTRPLALSEVNDAARYLFESARESKWPDALTQWQLLQHAAQDLPAGLQPADVASSLRTRMRELPDAVSQHDRIRTMEAANAITQSVIGLSSQFQSSVPAQIPTLAYLGRQIELGIAAQRPALITRATADIEQTWNALRPQLEHAGHVADVRRMTDIVVSLEGTNSAADEASLARAELDAVSHLEGELK
jgi:hypothetical protein